MTGTAIETHTLRCDRCGRSAKLSIALDDEPITCTCGARMMIVREELEMRAAVVEWSAARQAAAIAQCNGITAATFEAWTRMTQAEQRLLDVAKVMEA